MFHFTDHKTINALTSYEPTLWERMPFIIMVSTSFYVVILHLYHETKLYSSYQMHLHFSCITFFCCSFNKTKFFFHHKHIVHEGKFSLWIQFETKSILYASFSSAFVCLFLKVEEKKSFKWNMARTHVKQYFIAVRFHEGTELY